MKGPVPFVSGESVRQTLDIPTSVKLAKIAYAALSEGCITSPERAWVDTGRVALYCMPAYVRQGKTIVVKIARAQSDMGRQSSGPLTLATIYLFKRHSGEAVAIMEAEDLTAIRTAASSAVATDILATAQARRLGIIGAGKQAEAHIGAISQVRQIGEISMCSRTKEHVERLAQKTRRIYPRVQVSVHNSPEEVVRSSDILVLATSASQPLFDGKFVANGTHVNAIGAALPNRREVDTSLVKKSLVVVDSLDQALSSYGDIMIPLKEGAIDKSHVRFELGNLVAGRDVLERRSSDVTLFKSGGVAALDAVFAEYVAQKVL